MSTLCLEKAAAGVSSEIMFAPIAMPRAIQAARMQDTVCKYYDGLKQIESKGKFRCRKSSCPVVLEMAHSQSKEDKLLVVPQRQTETSGLTPLGESPPSSSPEPVRTKVAVENDRLSVYGVLQAKKIGNEIEVVVEPPDPTNKDSAKDLSCQFNYYIWYNPDDDTGPTKPPTYVLFENLLYENYFVSWDLENQTVRCEQLPLAPDMVIEDLESHIDDDAIQKFVWTIPADDDEDRFALKTYGESHFLAFERSGNAILVPGAKVNSDVTIFTFDMWN